MPRPRRDPISAADLDVEEPGLEQTQQRPARIEGGHDATGHELDAAFDHRAGHYAAGDRDALDRGAGADHHSGGARRRFERRGESAGTADRLARRRQQMRHPRRPVPEQVPERSRRARAHEARLERGRSERRLERVVGESLVEHVADVHRQQAERLFEAGAAQRAPGAAEEQQVGGALAERRLAARERRDQERRERRGQAPPRLLQRPQRGGVARASARDGGVEIARRIEVQALAAAEQLERSAARLEEAQPVALELELGGDRGMEALEAGERRRRAKAGMDLVGRERAAHALLFLEHRHRAARRARAE